MSILFRLTSRAAQLTVTSDAGVFSDALASFLQRRPSPNAALGVRFSVPVLRGRQCKRQAAAGTFLFPLTKRFKHQPVFETNPTLSLLKLYTQQLVPAFSPPTHASTNKQHRGINPVIGGSYKPPAPFCFWSLGFQRWWCRYQSSTPRPRAGSFWGGFGKRASLASNRHGERAIARQQGQSKS